MTPSATSNGTSAHNGDSIPPVENRPAPLKIAIVGAGIGGLTAAIGLRRNGHQVHSFEQSKIAGEIGAAVHLPPNSNSILRRWGIFAEEFGANTMDHMVEYTQAGRIRRDVPLFMANKRWQHPWHLVHRASLHDRLKHLATSERGAGPPAILNTSSKVTTVEPEQGIIRLANGTEITADVVIGADGIYSMTRRYIKNTDLFSSGKAAFRFLIPRSAAEADPTTAPLVKRKNTLLMWFGDDRRIVIYPCNNNQLLNFVCIHPDTESHTSRGDEWNKQGSVEQVLKIYRDFDPIVRALISKVDPLTLKVWQLLDMEKLPSWTTGKLVLLGDAAHPFTPHQGQGASQAIEDAAALSVVLPRDTAVDDITERLALYAKIRYDRAHSIQQYSRLAGMDWKDGKPAVDMMAFTNYNFGHDEIDHAGNIFKRWKWANTPNLQWQWQMPIGFGPLPGPPLHYTSKSIRGGLGQTVPDRAGPIQYTTMRVRFKTSRTFLETIFPSTRFQFKNADTVAMASLFVTKWEDIPRLDGNGYTNLALCIHNVQYTKKDGAVIDGAYIPVVFSPEPSTPSNSDNQDVDNSLPKVLCDIEISLQNNQAKRSSTFRLKASWSGEEFINITLSGLEEVDDYNTDEEVEEAENFIVYRYISAADQQQVPGQVPGQVVSDNEHACMIGGSKGEGGIGVKSSRVDGVWTSTETKVEIEAGDWGRFPKLHHVTGVLAEMPIYEVVDAKVVKGLGVEDGGLCRRIE